MAKKKDNTPTNESPEDMELWGKVSRSIRPLPDKKRVKNKPVEDEDAEEEEASVDRTWLSPFAPVFSTQKQSKAALGPLEVGDTHAVDASTAEKFRKGKMKIDGRLDMHGMTQAEASAA